MAAFNVYRPQGKKMVLIDTVFFNGYTVKEVRESLIKHDGYAPDIIVKLDS